MVAAAVLIKDHKILLGKRNYHLANGEVHSVWTYPGGRCDEGEKIEDTLRREIKEELDVVGVEISEYIGSILAPNKTDVVFMFLCHIEDDPKLMEPEKFSEWRWVLLGEYKKGEPWDSVNPLAHALICDFLKKKNW